MTFDTHIPGLLTLGDRNALIAIDDEVITRYLVDALGQMGYEVHLGFSTDDATIKLRAHPYQVVIISSVSTSSTMNSDEIYLEVVQLPITQRRRQFIAMLGPNLRTGDAMQAFAFSMDLVFNTADLPHLHKSLDYAIHQKEENNRIYLECMQTMDIAAL